MKTIDILTLRPLELLHMDIMCPTKIESLGGKKNIMVIIDDYSRYSWAIILREKFESFYLMSKLLQRI